MLGFKESPWIIHYDASSCNGCDIETLACLTPVFDVERLGVVNTGNPKHADIFVVTGAVNEQSKSVIRNIYEQLPEPKVVVAIGACAATGGIFRECYNVSGGVDTVIPVDVYVPGCAARPEAIIDGVVQAIAVLQDKHQQMALNRGATDQLQYLIADKTDAPEILALQKISFQSESALYGEDNVPPLQQTLEELRNEFDVPQSAFLKGVMNGKIIGSVRACAADGVARVSRLAVHPYFQRQGVGRRLMMEIEKLFPDAERYEIFTGEKSAQNLDFYRRLGYEPFKTEMKTPALTLIYLKKETKALSHASHL